MSNANISAIAVANKFIDLGLKDKGDSPSIDQMKLQKLTFYAHAWSLGIHKKPLFENDIEAWPWGPVVRDIYTQTKEHGRQPIKVPLTEVSLDTTTGKAKITEPEIEDSEIISFLEKVWEKYKKYTGIQLSNATHEPGEPWTLCKDLHEGDLSSKPTIPNHMIQSIFQSKLEKAS